MREPRLLEQDTDDAGSEASEQQPRDYTRSLAARDVIQLGSARLGSARFGSIRFLCSAARGMIPLIIFTRRFNPSDISRATAAAIRDIASQAIIETHRNSLAAAIART